MKRLHVLHIFTIFLMLWQHIALADDYPQSQILLETDKTIAGETLQYPQSGPAKITTVIINIPPGTSTGWHEHKVPLVAYLLSGELETEYANGKRVQLKTGQVLVEAMSVAHIGSNLGTMPAQLFVAFLGDGNTEFTQMVNSPSTPPATPNASATVDLVDLAKLDSRLTLDIRYATANNFMSKPLYTSGRPMLQRPAAEALKRAHNRLREAGYGLVILDAYRPWQVTREMWDKHPPYRAYLSDPLKGSRHNRGCAVDVTLLHLATGKEVSMPSAYDEFTERAHPDYKGGSLQQREARDLLRSAMEAEGYSVYENEWWHFDYTGWEAYPIMNQPL